MKNTVTTFQAMKDKGEKISMLTAYDYSTAKLEDAAGINGIWRFPWKCCFRI
mgnify:CR=1 FL=1